MLEPQSFQEKVKTLTDSIRNELERIDMHAEANELGGPDYDTIESLTDLIESKNQDIRELARDLVRIRRQLAEQTCTEAE